MLAADMVLQDRSKWLDRLADSAQVGLYVLSMRAEKPVCEYANKTWNIWTGAEDAPPGRKSWLSFFHPEDRLRMQQLYLRVLLTGSSEKTEYRLIGCPRETIHAADTVCPLWDAAAGETVGLCGTVQDISLLKSAREEMQRTQLLQSLGGLMAGIAHEMNTPLQFIGDNLQFIADAWKTLSAQQAAMLEAVGDMRMHSQEAPEATDRIERVCRMPNAEFLAAEFPRAVSQSLEGIERLIQLVSAMRDFSHLDERRQAPADLNRAVRSALTLLQNELKYACDVQTQLDPALPEVNCSIDEINRVLLNLLTNAVHSIAEKIERGGYTRGRIRIGTSSCEAGVRIFIEDNGTGIAADIRDRVFERYFTTKRNHPERRGTGQGLSMAYETIVDHHQGSLTFETSPGKGTTFTIILPVQPHLKEQRG